MANKLMQNFVKYKRIEYKDIDSLQTFFDGLITEGWQIIYYNEVEDRSNIFGFKVVVVVGKKHNTI